MSSTITKPFVHEGKSLHKAGFGNDAIEAWHASMPPDTGDFTGDRERYSPFWAASAAMLAQLPAKPARNAGQADAAEHIKRVAREARTRFLSAHAGAVYDRLTRSRTRFVRVEQLIYDAAVLVPGLTPTQAQVDAESALMQRDKEGHEVDQGISFHVCSPTRGRERTFATPCCCRALKRSRNFPNTRRLAISIWAPRKFFVGARLPMLSRKIRAT